METREPQEAVKVSPIQAALNEAGERLMSLNELVSRLENTLEPVLQQLPPTDDKPAGQLRETRGNSPHVTQIDAINSATATIHARVEGLLARVEA